MTQSNLNHECLVKVFSYVYGLDDLINCLYVCKLWNGAVKERLNKAEHLISFDPNYFHNIILHPNTINLDPEAILSEYENEENFKDPSHRFTLKYLGSHLTPNIKIVILDEFFTHYREDGDRSLRLNKRILSDFRRATSSMNHLKGSQHLGSCLLPVDCVNNLEIYRVYSSELRENTKHVRDYVDFSSKKLKQLFCDWKILTKHAHHLENIRYLRLFLFGEDPLPKDSVFPNLEMLIYNKNTSSKSPVKAFAEGFDLLRVSPKLKSIYYLCWAIDDPMDKSDDLPIERFPNIKDLAIYVGEHVNWLSLKNFLRYFPNVKHLSLKWNSIIKNRHIKELIELFPNLAILDVRYCTFVTRSAEKIFHDYNIRNRTTKKIMICPKFLVPKLLPHFYILCGTSFMDTFFYRIPEDFLGFNHLNFEQN